MDKDANKLPRRNWTPAETTAFLHAYGNRQSEFHHPRKKKFAMANVLEDLEADGVFSQPTTTAMLENKLKNLLRAFKGTNDSQKKTGEGASKAPFEDLMEDLFGTRPEIKNSHTVNLSGKPITAMPVPKIQSQESEERSNAQLENVVPVSSLQAQNEAEIDSQYTSPPRCSAPAPPKKKRLSPKDMYLKDKISLKRESTKEKNEMRAKYYKEKLKKIDEAEKAKEERFKNRTETIKMIFSSSEIKK